MLNKELFEKLKRLSLAEELPSHDYIAYIADKVVTVLENENTDYRESFSAGKPGGLLDFTKFSLPLVIIPDIHARSDFLQNILSSRSTSLVITYDNFFSCSFRCIRINHSFYTDYIDSITLVTI